MEKDKIKVLLVGQNKNINVAKFPVEEDKIVIQKDKFEPQFDPECLFYIKEISTTPIFGKLINKHRKRETCLLQVVGKQYAEKLNIHKSNPGDIFEPLTNEERKDIVRREIAKTLKRFKPITPLMFIVLLVLGIVNIILTIIMLSGGKIAI